MTTPTLTSQVPAVIDYLVAQCTASTSLGAASPPVVIHDGPEVTGDDLAEALHLWIGGLPQAAATQPVTATADQDFAFSDRGRTRNETGEITCAADAWSGSVILKAQRDACAAIIGAVELLLRGDPATGAPGDYSMGGLVLWSQVSGPYEWTPRQTQSGSGMTCAFRISYKARLTTTP